ncbi:MAG TPA: hypothetical protein VJ464_01945, partial [Blastocatellia bacterium]|nr:hypothetical protein [Blastocatellia bacterium]
EVFDAAVGGVAELAEVVGGAAADIIEAARLVIGGGDDAPGGVLLRGQVAGQVVAVLLLASLHLLKLSLIITSYQAHQADQISPRYGKTKGTGLLKPKYNV